MSEASLIAVTSCFALGALIGLVFRRSLLAKSIAILLTCCSLGLWALVMTFDLYQQNLAPTISRHNTTVQLSTHPTYGFISIVFNVTLGLILVGVGCYFAFRRYREWQASHT